MKLFYNILKLAIVAVVAAAALIISFGCASSGLYAMSDKWCMAHPNAPASHCAKVWFPLKSQSWDQENLKKNDSGCPTAIYDAPNGNLRLCGAQESRHEMRIETTFTIVAVPQQISTSTFATLNEAAVRALENAYRISHYYEVGGILGKLGVKYVIGQPTSDVSGDSISVINMDPLSYKGVIVATYHTHPCNSNTHLPSVFSPNDTHSDRSYKVIGYMADLCTGKVTMYNPEVDIGLDADSPEGWKGHDVGQFAVDGVVLDEHLREAL